MLRFHCLIRPRMSSHGNRDVWSVSVAWFRFVRFVWLFSKENKSLCFPRQQNIHDPEIYLSQYDLENDITGERIRSCAIFADSLDPVPGFYPNMSSPSAVTDERLPIHCISIPGECSWATAAVRRGAAIWHPRPISDRAGPAQKRTHDQTGDDEAMPDSEQPLPANTAPPTDTKRQRGGPSASGGAEQAAAPLCGSGPAAQAVVKLYGAHAQSGAIKVRREHMRRCHMRRDLPKSLHDPTIPPRLACSHPQTTFCDARFLLFISSSSSCGVRSAAQSRS
jgi:hypothetical protein